MQSSGAIAVARRHAFEVGRTAVTATLLAVVILAVFSALPPTNPTTSAPSVIAAGFAVDLLIFGAIVVLVTLWQVRRVRRSNRAVGALVEAIVLIFALFIGIMGRLYHVASIWNPEAFNRPLTFGDAAYFSMTVFSTVGFGDIYPAIALTKGLVAFQMVVDLVLLGVVVRLLADAAKRSDRRQVSGTRARRSASRAESVPLASRRALRRARRTPGGRARRPRA